MSLHPTPFGLPYVPPLPCMIGSKLDTPSWLDCSQFVCEKKENGKRRRRERLRIRFQRKGPQVKPDRRIKHPDQTPFDLISHAFSVGTVCTADSDQEERSRRIARNRRIE